MATGSLYGSSSESTGLYGIGAASGGTYFEWFVFQDSATAPATPTGGSWSFSTNTGVAPTGWLNAPPAAPVNQVWVSIAVVDSRNVTTLVWSIPGLMTGSGLPILSASGVPSSGTGLNGQLYINTATTPQSLYFKRSGAWTQLTGSTLYATAGANANITSLTGITGGISSPTFVQLATTGGVGDAVAKLHWNSTFGGPTIGLAGGNTNLQIGQDEFVYVHNNTGSTITKGQVVYISGSQGQRLTVALARANADATSISVIGFANENIANNADGFVATVGLVSGINTNGFADGASIWLSPTVAGGFTTTKPVAPNHLVLLGYVVKGGSAGAGSIYVFTQNGYELDELHDVRITSVANNNLLRYDSSVPAWVNIAGPSGTIVGTTDTQTLTNKSISGSANTLTNIPNSALVNSSLNINGVNFTLGAVQTIGPDWILPSYAGNAGKVLAVNPSASDVQWIPAAGVGTVTSIDISGGTTGLTTFGGPITAAGTITLGGTLAVANGGTGATNAATARTNLGLGTMSTQNANAVAITGGAINGTVGATTANTGAFTTLSASGVTTVQAGTAAAPAITTSGDTNTGIFFPAADTIAFSEGGVEAARFDSSGNLGIGTSSPAARLDVTGGSSTGGAIVSGSIASVRASSTVIDMGDSNRLMALGPNTTTAGTFKFIVASSNASVYNTAATLDSSGNLGLGVTPSPWFIAKAIQVNERSALFAFTNDTHLSYNSVFASPGSYRYIASDLASDYRQTAGQHQWLTAPSGVANSASITTGVVYVVAGLGTSTLAQWQAFFSALTVLPTVGQTITATATGTLVGGGTVTQTITFTQAMTLNASGNLGIGTTSPAFRLDVSGSIRGTGGTNALRLDNTANAGVYARFVRPNKSYILALDINNNGGNDFTLFDETAGASRLTVDNSGNLGLGVTPSAWGSGYRAIGINAQGFNTYSITASSTGGVTSNAFNNGTNWIYVNSQASGRYEMVGAAHSWYTAPSGTAGNAITFTQAMTLDANGRLFIGTTSGTERINVANVANSPAGAEFAGNGNVIGTASLFVGQSITGDGFLFQRANQSLIFGTNAAERARITSAGELLVGTTSLGGSGGVSVYGGSVPGITINKSASGGPFNAIAFQHAGTTVGSITTTNTATAYNTSSDYRLKNVLGAVTGAGERIDALEPVEYEWKSDGSRTRGFLAHKFQEVYAGSVTGSKDAVDAEGNPVYQAMQASSSEVIADLVAEIQSLRQRLAAAGI